MSGSFTLRLEPLGRELPVADGQTCSKPRSPPASACAVRAATAPAASASRTWSRAASSTASTGPACHPTEKAQGWVLPCVAMAQSDVLLRQPFQDADASASMP